MIRSISPTDTPNPFQVTAPQHYPRQHSIADVDRSLPSTTAPLLQLPLPAQSLSESTDAETAQLTTTPLVTAPYDIQIKNDGVTVIGTDNHAMESRFLTDQETKHVKLPKCSTRVPWANMSIFEFKHHQSHESGMQNIWCPSPYCWLLSEQLLQALKQRSNKEDVWLRLWHFLDTLKTEANKSTKRLAAAHEINLQPVVHHHLVDDQLRQQIRAKIVNGFDACHWSTPMQKLEHILSNWDRHVHLILPQIDEKANLPILMIFYHWQTPIRSYTNHTDPVPVVQTIPWGHATNIDSGIQIVNSGGLRPSATVD